MRTKRFLLLILSLLLLTLPLYSHPKSQNGSTNKERVVLKKCKSFARQVKNKNTTYIIRHIFNLKGDVVHIPEGCILEFDGGSVYNGLIVGEKMPSDLVYRPEMFGSGKSNDDTRSIQSAFNICKTIVLDGEYNVFADENKLGNACLEIPSNTNIVVNGLLRCLSTHLERYFILLVNNATNVSIKGEGVIIGDRHMHEGQTGEWGHGIGLYKSNNIVISGVEISNCWGDGIYIHYGAPVCNQVHISNVYIHDCRRQGISVTGGSNIIIDHFKIENIRGTNPQSAIDIENESALPIEFVSINHGEINNCYRGVILQNRPPVEISRMKGYNAQDRLSGISISNINSKSSTCLLTHNASFKVCSAPVEIDGPCVIERSTIKILNTANPEKLEGNCEILDSEIKGLVNMASSPSIRVMFKHCDLSFDSLKDNSFFRNVNGSLFRFEESKIFFKTSIIAPYTVVNSEFYKCSIDCYDTPYLRCKLYDCDVIVRLMGEDTRVFINRGNTEIYDSRINILGTKDIPLFYLESGEGRSNFKIEGTTIIDVKKNRTRVVDKSNGTFVVKDKGTNYNVK